MTIPPTLKPTLSFNAGSKMAIFDNTENVINGRMILSDSGYTMSDQSMTLVAYADTDPTIRLTVRAMAAASGIAPHSGNSPYPVRARIIRNQLVLQAQTYELTFKRL